MAGLPDSMTQIAITEPGNADVLKPETARLPYPGEGQILLRVEAAGINRPDVLQRRGLYPPPKGASAIPGLEIAGTVAIAGRGVSRFQEGDKVCALVNGGGYAQYCLAEAGSSLPVPAGLDMIEAAALPETFFTVWHNVFERGGLQEGEWLLVHGGSSGIGTTAIQMAKAFGAKVLTTAGSHVKCSACERLGADRAINYLEEDFVAIAKEETGKRGVDVILDMVGGDYVERNLRVAAADGRIVQIAFLNGSQVELDLMRLMLKRLTLTGSTLRARSEAVKAGIARALEEKVWPLVESGKIRPVIDSTYPLAQAATAHRRMESNDHIGKIVLTTG